MKTNEPIPNWKSVKANLEQNMETNKPIPNWKTVVTDNIVYNPLTGNYTYKEQDTPDTYNEFWTPLGQPRTTGRMTEKVNKNKDTTRKEKGVITAPMMEME